MTIDASKIPRWLRRFLLWTKIFVIKRHNWDQIKISTVLEVKINRWDPVKKEYKGWYLHDRNHNLKTNAGVAFFAAQCYAGNSGGSIGTNGTNFMALTTTAITPAVGDTTLSGELTTNGMARSQATVSIGSASGGSVTTTITDTWTDTTATTSNIQGGAVFTASSSGTMGHEYTFTSTTLAVGDSIQTTLTVTVS